MKINHIPVDIDSPYDIPNKLFIELEEGTLIFNPKKAKYLIIESPTMEDRTITNIEFINLFLGIEDSDFGMLSMENINTNAHQTRAGTRDNAKMAFKIMKQRLKRNINVEILYEGVRLNVAEFS